MFPCASAAASSEYWRRLIDSETGPEFSNRDEDLLSGFAASAVAAVATAQDVAAHVLRRSIVGTGAGTVGA
jgi:hypothetical protein